jgi:hypothetical protein
MAINIAKLIMEIEILLKSLLLAVKKDFIMKP